MSAFNLAAIMPRRLPGCCVFGLLLLSACAGEPPARKPQFEVKPPASVKRPKPAEAATTARSYRLHDSRSALRLLDADTRLQAGDSNGARQALDGVNPAELNPEQTSKYKLLDGEIALSSGDAESAVRKLEGVRPAVLAEADQIAYYQSMAFAQSLTGDVLAGVRMRLKLGRILTDRDRQKQNIIAILDALSVLPNETLSTTASVADELSGWMALAKILKQRNLPGFDSAGQIQQWKQTFPGHPANADYLQAYLNGAPAVAAEPAAESGPETPQPAATAASGPIIAVLLPNSGQYAAAGKAVRNGLATAYRLAASAAPQPALKYYDSEAGDIVALYKQAVAAGAKQVIGPLVKEQIQTLADSGELSVPVLALNHVENLSKANLYQFGLSPIDDAEQLALKARRDGLQNAVLLTPETPQGQRIRHYLMSAWQAAGGSVLGVQSYDPKSRDFSAVVKALLAPSVNAAGEKQALAVFISAGPEQAREIAPQLRYSQSSELAVYAMPNIYSGRPNPAKDTELGKIAFCDLPWLFGEVYGGPLSQQALQSAWQGLSDSQIKLVALGVDAFNLLGQLGQLAATPYPGATGRLALNGENRITRKLACAEFKAGVPAAAAYVE
ncbi:LppC family lipoprotein [Methylomonas koyamae]|uniref:LppC family lipoprotein n=1 Tax=Methylomonas koyamae TaxID=702114 RepID=A0A177NAG3_9GAMM|nr:penicillin-binding protein activator [Methylomonas koyamae]OAI14584.1 LppC family lipoprotein [Methylomonas koyamae]